MLKCFFVTLTRRKKSNLSGGLCIRFNRSNLVGGLHFGATLHATRTLEKQTVPIEFLVNKIVKNSFPVA